MTKIEYHGVLVELSPENSHYEKEETELALRYFDGYKGTAVLAGGGLGWLAACVAAGGTDVHAYEPLPGLAELCRANIGFVESDTKPGTIIWTEGILSDRHGMASFSVVENWACSTAHQEPEHDFPSGKNKVNEIEVQAFDIAGVVRGVGSGTAVALCLDVEGFELELLRHLLATGAISRIDRGMIEIHRQYYGQPGVDEMREALLFAGFVIEEVPSINGAHRGPYWGISRREETA